MEERYEIHGPTADSPLVEAWAEDYIRFEPREMWQKQLRHQIRSHCSQLVAASEQVLHATFFGHKHVNADVENLALYNIGSFENPGRNGIRFEHSAVVPLAPNRREFAFSYRYALAPRSATFNHWQPRRPLASFDWTDLGEFAGEKKLAQVWLALSRGSVHLADQPCTPGAPFALKIHLRPPLGRKPVLGNLVKGVFDGVISAFQVQSDVTVLADAAARIASIFPAEAEEVEKHLLDEHRAVLGVVPRLVAPYRQGVKWNPADHRCVAGELLGADPVGPRWAIKGEVLELDAQAVNSTAS